MKNHNAGLSMSKNLKTISWQSPMAEAHRLMEDYNIRHLPVVDSSNAIIGVLSDRDVSKAMNPNRPGFAQDTVVGDFMSWPVITVDENRPIKDVAEGMITEKISSFLVTSKGREVVGIITTEDLLRYLVEALGKEKKSSFLDFTYTPLVAELMRETETVGI